MAIVLLGAAATYAWYFQKIQSGRLDLVINEGARNFQLPLTYGRKERSLMPFSNVRAVMLKSVRHQSKGGTYYTYLVTLEFADYSQAKLVNLNRKRAEAFAAWLREKLGVASPAMELDPQA